MKQVLLAFGKGRYGAIATSKLFFLTVMSVLLGACDPGIDFNPNFDKVKRPPPENLEPHHVTNGKNFYQIACGQNTTFRYTNVSANMGMISLHTVKSETGTTHCGLSVVIVEKNGTASGNTYTRTVAAGESMTEVMDLNGTNNIEVSIKCEGASGACLFSEPQFTVGKNSANPNRPYADINANPQPHRDYDNDNTPCENSFAVTLHKVYLDYPPGAGLTFQAVSKCLCSNFVVSIEGRDDQESRAPQNRSGTTETVTAFDANVHVVTIVGRCDDKVNQNSSCEGDVNVQISGRNTR